MKKPIFTFLFVFMLLGGMTSTADNAVLDSISGIESEVALQASAATADGSEPSTAPVPNSATMLLIATGLVGLAGVSRRNNS